MNEIRITAATDLPPAFAEALERWRAEAARVYREEKISWYSKLVSTIFTYEGKHYAVYASDVFDPALVKDYTDRYMYGVLEAYFELIQNTVAADLVELGATGVRSFGFLD